MTAHQTAPPAADQAMVRTAAIGPTYPLAVTDEGGWTAQRLAVINEAGECAPVAGSPALTP